MDEVNQQEVWDKIAEQWNNFRQEPLKEVEIFLNNKSENSVLLDLACGSGRHFRKGFQIWGVDFSSEMLKYAQEKLDKLGINGNLVKSSATELPFQDNFFDCVIYIAGLHCLTNDSDREKSLRELFRVLKKDKEAIITVWSKNHRAIAGKTGEMLIDWEIKGKKEKRYYYIYEINELRDVLEKVGFEIVSVTENDNIVFVVKKN
jgi:ubiquinone/menaquinone biosynthesis C-methylase UbiE